MSESKQEYEMTRRFPRNFEFENGPKLWREALVHIIGGSVMQAWSTESNGTHVIYRQDVNQHNPYGRGFLILTDEYEKIPESAAMAVGEAFAPDDVMGAMAVLGGQLTMISPLPIGCRRPGKN